MLALELSLVSDPSALLQPDDGWLFGQFTAADAFYIVVASRFRTYRVDISSERYPLAKLYYERIWTDEAVKRVVNRAVENKVWMLDHYEVSEDLFLVYFRFVFLEPVG